jgi:hypothetical protein
MTRPTFTAIPAIKAETATPAHPLRVVLIAAFTLATAVSVLLLGMASLAPPTTESPGYSVSE